MYLVWWIRILCHMVSNKNRLTGEEVVFMTVECNELTLDICINQEDLYGEAAAGRRFKGVVWLQGYINYPQENVP